MAITYTVSPSEAVSSTATSFFREIRTLMKEFGRARAASAMYEELNGLSDEQLDKMGLARNDISRKVFAKVYDLH